ncbi:MAG: restriction endonuclease subunit S [Candidatus Methanoperedens sp.]|nr:restriction endonuclease subunit S [Candidatus Methanoperedens sp.]
MSIELAPTISSAPARSWKPYPAYKDSGVEWLGKVPEHWEVWKIKHSTYVKGRIGWKGLTSNDFLDEGAYLVTGTDFVDGKVNWETCYHVSYERFDEDPYIQLKEKDILITKDGTIGKIAIAENLRNKATLNSGIFLIRPLTTNYLNDFMYWILNSEVFSTFISFTKTGSTIQHLYQNVFEDFSFPVPLIPEQRAIAHYLDDRTRKIDSLIEKKQKLIELLKEERSAVINQAVTKGLNPRAPMRDSGVEWLGEVPEKWELRKIGRSFNLIGSGATPESGNKKYYEKGVVAWINTGDLNDGILDSCEKKITNEAFENYTALKIYPKGTILVAMYGATIGKVGLLNFEACTNQACCALGKSSFFIDKFVFYWFLANKRNIVNLSFGGGQPNISQEIIKSLKLTCPPIEEQQSIVQFIESELAIIDDTVSRIEKEIALLQEYRTALISEVVTGKIDVRGE